MSEETAKTLAAEVAAHLKSRYGATRVLLFGSAAEGTFLPGRSDIDLYFEGIDYDREFAVTGKTLCAFPSLDLDLIPAGHAPEYLRRNAESTGIAL